MNNKIIAKLRKKGIFFTLLILFFSSCIFAGEGKLSVGFGYPYFSVKYHPMEVKYATGEGIGVFAGRFYYDFYSERKIKGFAGIEAGKISFDTLDIKGSGYEGSLFIGGEYFILRKLSLMLDFSPTFIDIKSDDDYKTDGFAMVANFAVYFYFSSKKQNEIATAISSPRNDNKKKIISEENKENKLSETEKKALMSKHFNRATQLYSEGKYKEAIAE